MSSQMGQFIALKCVLLCRVKVEIHMISKIVQIFVFNNWILEVLCDEFIANVVMCLCVGSGDITAVLHVLELLKSVISEFPRSALKSTCELVLGLLGIHNTVSACAVSCWWSYRYYCDWFREQIRFCGVFFCSLTHILWHCIRYLHCVTVSHAAAAAVCCCLAVDWSCNENHTWNVCCEAKANESSRSA